MPARPPGRSVPPSPATKSRASRAGVPAAPAAKPHAKKVSAADADRPPAELIDARVRELGDWRGELLARLRRVITGADAAIVEDWKWNVPVWSCHGILCTGETYKKAVKLTFAQGAALPDPSHLFNASLEGNTRRAIDFPEGCDVDEGALAQLLRAAVAHNAKAKGARGKASG